MPDNLGKIVPYPAFGRLVPFPMSHVLGLKWNFIYKCVCARARFLLLLNSYSALS